MHFAGTVYNSALSKHSAFLGSLDVINDLSHLLWVLSWDEPGQIYTVNYFLTLSTTIYVAGSRL